MIRRLARSTWLEPGEVAAVITDTSAFGRRLGTCTVVLRSGARIPFVDSAEVVGRRIRECQEQ